ncbi:hypothetical protein L4C36_18770 [Photobacterium japonica]|uniref:hypothetical protein n=1 Tax=Photobacterium japonica TaxID=2910235 RepID=UPI003D0E2D4E
MAYITGTANSAESMQQAFDALFSLPVQHWDLMRCDPLDGVGRVTVKHKHRDWALAFEFPFVNYSGGSDTVKVAYGTDYSGQWPGLVNPLRSNTHAQAGSGDSAQVMTWPLSYALVCSDSYFFVFLWSMANGRIRSGGCCLLDGVSEYHNDDAIYLTQMGGLAHLGHPNWSSGYSYGDRDSLEWIGSLIHFRNTWSSLLANPRSRNPFPNTHKFTCPYKGQYDANWYIQPDEMAQLYFEPSATTPFFPLLFAHCRDDGLSTGYEISHEAPQIRLCSMKYFGNGDTVIYQGRKWAMFNVLQSGQCGVALQLDEGD